MASEKIKKYFKGKLVGVVTKSIRGTQVSNTESFSGNHVIEGLYKDEDKYFLFLADKAGNMVDAVHKKDIVRIFIVDFENTNNSELN